VVVDAALAAPENAVPETASAPMPRGPFSLTSVL